MAKSELLHVICHRPGLVRGGRAHPAWASYEPGAFTLAQLGDLDKEPAITLLIGRQPTAEDLAAEASEVIAIKGTDNKKAKG
jgi:hypothetical protein